MTPVCHIDDLPNPGTRSVQDQHQDRDIAFVVRHHQDYSAFYNQCPHTGAPLNWQPDRFLTIDERHILCGIHGARFRLTDGLCISGPCVGQSLTAITVVVKNDIVHLDP